MYIKTVYELSLVLDSEKFDEIFDRTSSRLKELDTDSKEYIDESLASKGITVIYRDSQYKKKVTLIVNEGLLTKGKKSKHENLVCVLEKRINSYFSAEYALDDFTLSGVILTADINVHRHERVVDYLTVLRRVGRVKGFSPTKYEEFEDAHSFCLEGNSNGTAFLLYDAEGFIGNQIWKTGEARGILRAEVRLVKPKAIRAYTDQASISDQITALETMKKEVFLDTFMRVVPFGDFHKKGKATEIIRREIHDRALRRRMLRLLSLIPEKKSLHLAQKEMKYRSVDKIMSGFESINLSPVTISKRHTIKYLKNIYTYL